MTETTVATISISVLIGVWGLMICACVRAWAKEIIKEIRRAAQRRRKGRKNGN